MAILLSTSFRCAKRRSMCRTNCEYVAIFKKTQTLSLIQPHKHIRLVCCVFRLPTYLHRVHFLHWISRKHHQIDDADCMNEWSSLVESRFSYCLSYYSLVSSTDLAAQETKIKKKNFHWKKNRAKTRYNGFAYPFIWTVRINCTKLYGKCSVAILPYLPAIL